MIQSRGNSSDQSHAMRFSRSAEENTQFVNNYAEVTRTQKTQIARTLQLISILTLVKTILYLSGPQKPSIYVFIITELTLNSHHKKIQRIVADTKDVPSFEYLLTVRFTPNFKGNFIQSIAKDTEKIFRQLIWFQTLIELP